MDWKSRVRAALATSSPIPDDDVLEELAQHARSMYEAARADGCADDEADQRVIDQFDRWRREAPALRHRPRRPPAVEPPPAAAPSRLAGLAQDARYGMRLIRRQPRFAALVIVTMAVGIAATTVLFSVTYGLLMKPLPWPDAGRLVVLEETRGGKPPRFGSFTNTAYLAWQDKAATIDALAAWSQSTVTLAGAGDPDRIRITSATASLFRVLDAHPLVGSTFEEEDETSPVVVLSERLWRQRFGADPAVLGRVVRLNGEAHTVIGVLPDRAAYPDRQTLAWTPFHVRSAQGNYLSMFNAIARLRPGVTAAQAAAEGTGRGRFAADTGMTTMAVFGGRGPVEIAAQPLGEALTADVRRPLIILLAAVALLLVTATANVASLQLARATTRRREMAIRAALGAGSLRVTRQLLVENVLLALAGGGAGLGLAWLLHRAMPSALPADFPRADDVTLNAPVVLFAIAVSVLTGIAFGVLPALRARRLNLVESLAEDGSSPIGARGRSRTTQLRLAIMTAQVAIACMLLIGASLVGRSFMALLTADRGYNPTGVLTARLSLPSALYPAERRHELARQMLERLSAMPGVTSSAFTSELPLTPGGSTAAFTMRSPHAEGGTVSVQASPRIVSPAYFGAAGMRIRAGRGFLDTDNETSLPVVVVNHAFARRYLGDSALGSTLPTAAGYQSDDGTQATVVGVVDDVRYLTAADATQPELYFSYRQMKGRLAVPVITLLVRTTGDPSTLGPSLRAVVRGADGGLVPEAVMTMEDRMVRGLARPRLYAILLGGFAGFALLVAGVGLVGVLSYTVTQRSRELALRVALGARPSDIVGLVLRQGLGVTMAGLAVGMLGSFAATQALGALLYGVAPHDRFTYIAVPIVLAVVSAIACIGPARRAARLDPLRGLRE